MARGREGGFQASAGFQPLPILEPNADAERDHQRWRFLFWAKRSFRGWHRLPLLNESWWIEPHDRPRAGGGAHVVTCCGIIYCYVSLDLRAPE